MLSLQEAPRTRHPRPLDGEGNPSDLGNLVELAEKFIEHEHQLLRGALAGQPREAHDVSIQHTVQEELC